MINKDITKLYIGDNKVWESPALTTNAPDFKDLTQANSITYAVGSRVELTRPSNIRTEARIAANTLRGINLRGWRGTIVSGPEPGPAGTSFFEVEFDRGAWNGWVVDDNFQPASTVIVRTPEYFKVDDSIILFRKSNVRSTPVMNAGSLLGTNPKDATGTIKEGPTKDAENNIWYRIEFEEGRDGWIASDNYLLNQTFYAGADGSWVMLHFSSQRAFDNPTQYRYGKSGHQIQFCHGGVRSEANPNDACFIMDVGGPWVTENAEADWPRYTLAGCAGLEAKNSASAMWDPDIAGRLIHIAGGRAGGPWNRVGSRTGIYTSENKGQSFTLRHAVLIHCEVDDRSTRSFRQMVNYTPKNHNIWYCLSPKYHLSKSTDRAVTWNIINSNVQSMGQVWYVQPDYANINTIWFAAETGLYRSTNGGTTISKVSPPGLPGGAVTSFAFDPDDANKWLAVVGTQGIYRTINGGASFTRVPTPTQWIAQVFQSRLNKNRLWYMGINAEPAGTWSRSRGATSANGGASWTTCITKGDTYGIDRGSPDVMRAEWSAGGNGSRAMATGILPSPRDEDRAIATWGHCLWRTKNAVNWDNASDGFSNQAGGDVNFGAMDFVGNRIAFAAFDKRGFFSANKGDTWRQCSFASTGMASKGYVGLTISMHATKPKMLTTQGFYNPNPSTVILSYDNGGSSANSKRPSFFASNYGNNDFQKWAHFHKTGAPNVAYSTTAYSGDEGETWTKWTSRADSVYRSAIGEPADRSSRAGVRMCSPNDNDWLIATPASGGGGMYLSKNRGLNWNKFTSGNTAVFGSDVASLWMDPTNKNIIYWWQTGVGLMRYDEATKSEAVCPGTVQYKNMFVQRVRSSYQNANHIYFFNRQDGKSMVYRSTSGWRGEFVDITENLPRQIGNQGFEIDPYTGIIWMNGVVGTRIYPPPGGHPRFNVLASRSQ